MRLLDLDTPVLFVNLDIMTKNIRDMHQHLRKHGIKCRPHVKTHKVPALAHHQLREGAIGITCQKISEAEVMVSAGITDVLISFNIVGVQKLESLVRLAKQARISVVADSEDVARGLSEAMDREKLRLRVLVECDIAQLRTGVRTPEQATKLAQFIEKSPSLEYGGLMQFKGGYPDIEFIKRTGEFFNSAVEMLVNSGIETRTVSSGGTVYAKTAWPDFAEHLSMVDECRPGAYIFYDRIKVAEGVTNLENCSARILATVISRPESDMAVLDAGSKTLGIRRGYGEDLGSYGYIVEYPDAMLNGLFEEHGVVKNCPREVRIGEKVTIIPNYVMDNVNFHDVLYGVSGQHVEAIWPISARGKSQ